MRKVVDNLTIIRDGIKDADIQEKAKTISNLTMVIANRENIDYGFNQRLKQLEANQQQDKLKFQIALKFMQEFYV